MLIKDVMCKLKPVICDYISSDRRLDWGHFHAIRGPHAASTRRSQERAHPCIVPRVSTRYPPCAHTNKNT